MGIKMEKSLKAKKKRNHKKNKAQKRIVWRFGPNVTSAFPSLRWRFCSNKRTDDDTLLPRAPLASSKPIVWSIGPNVTSAFPSLSLAFL